MILRRLHLACFLVLIGLGLTPLAGVAQGSVTGVVRDSAGAPQIGAVVQLLRPDMTVLASAYTNSKGRFSFSTVLPGHYAVKAMGTSFLPSLRENVRVRTSTVVNLTLNTLYEVMQWLPAEPRSATAPKDDWQWTLKSAANRPLLRWLEDGPLLVVTDAPNAKPRLKARLMASGQEGAFGEDGQRITVEVEDTPSDSRELLARVDFDPRTDAGMESMLGFRQDLGYAGAVQSVAAVALHPDVEGGGGDGLDEATMRTWQNLNVAGELEAEVGAEQVLARFAHNGPNTVFEALPFATVAWHAGDATIRYKMATAVPGRRGANDADVSAWLPAMSLVQGRLAAEHGLHQEIGWERRGENGAASVALYADTLRNQVLEAVAQLANGDGEVLDGALYDASSGLIRTGAARYSGVGVVATAERRLANGSQLRLTYANGDALVMQDGLRAAHLAQLVASARPKRTQMYSISLSGTLDGTGTRWRASYRWQPEDTVSRVAPYMADAAEPYLTVRVRQPMCKRGEGVKSLDAMIDMRNVLGQGERSYVLRDGSLLMFAQDQRSLSAGLAFTF